MLNSAMLRNCSIGGIRLVNHCRGRANPLDMACGAVGVSKDARNQSCSTDEGTEELG